MSYLLTEQGGVQGLCDPFRQPFDAKTLLKLRSINRKIVVTGQEEASPVEAATQCCDFVFYLSV
jgi:hypothetical protein